MIKIQVNKTDLITEIRENLADEQYYFKSYYSPSEGKFYRLSTSIYVSTPDDIVEIPALDPEGSGRLGDHFDDFVGERIRRGGSLVEADLRHLPDFGEWLVSHADEDDGREEYLAYASENGWDDAEADWEEYQLAQAEYLAEEWAEALRSSERHDRYDVELVS